MNFADLQERLRQELVRRINADALTGSRLAQQTGFRQAHISNFLNRKRALSLEGLDRVLAAQNLTIGEILHKETLTLHAAADPAPPIESIPVLPPSVAMNDAVISSQSAIEYVAISPTLLCENRARCPVARTPWQRFVAIRSDASQAAAMDPLITAGSTVLIDRHYTSLAHHRSQQPNLYAVRCGNTLQLGFAAFDDGRIILRPNSNAFPVQLVPVASGQSPSDLIIGRVCLVLNEF